MSRKARGLDNWLKYNARGNVTTGNAKKKKKWAQKKSIQHPEDTSPQGPLDLDLTPKLVIKHSEEDLFMNSYIYSFFQVIFTSVLVCVKHGDKIWGCGGEPKQAMSYIQELEAGGN